MLWKIVVFILSNQLYVFVTLQEIISDEFQKSGLLK